MRYVAIDLGDKRTGLAAGDAVTGLASPAGVLEVPMAQGSGEALLQAIAKAVHEQLGPPIRGNRAELIVGLPVNMDGTEGPRAKATREFAARIATRTGRTVRFQDERLTSADADWAMARTGLTRKQKKERRDALAAAAILKDYLSGLRGNGAPDAAS
jgi:putative Holliday junction resolvase